jgi:hypothetical protein
MFVVTLLVEPFVTLPFSHHLVACKYIETGCISNIFLLRSLGEWCEVRHVAPDTQQGDPGICTGYTQSSPAHRDEAKANAPCTSRKALVYLVIDIHHTANS